MSLYQLAVQAVRAHVDETQAKLDAAAAQARQNTIAALRALAVQGVPENSPAYPVCALVANTIAVGRKDGYPAASLPPETRAVLVAAWNADIIDKQTGGLEWYADFSGLADSPQPLKADYEAWDAARTYRNRQTVAQL